MSAECKATLNYELSCLRAPLEDTTDRRADVFVGTVDAANPATWPVHTPFEFLDDSLDVFVARFLLFWRYDPAYPLIASERREALP